MTGSGSNYKKPVNDTPDKESAFQEGGANYIKPVNETSTPSKPIQDTALLLNQANQLATAHTLDKIPDNATELGVGNFGKVYKISLKDPNSGVETSYALKLMKDGEASFSEHEIRNVLHLQKKTPSDLITHYKFAKVNNELSVISEVEMHGSLDKLVTKIVHGSLDKEVQQLSAAKKSGEMIDENYLNNAVRVLNAFHNDPGKALAIFSQKMHDCVEALHDRNILSLDVAARNFLVGEFTDAHFEIDPATKKEVLKDAPLKIADFGLSEIIDNTNQIVQDEKIDIPMKYIDKNTLGSKEKPAEYSIMSDAFCLRSAMLDLSSLAKGYSQHVLLSYVDEKQWMSNNERLSMEYHVAKNASWNCPKDNLPPEHLQFREKCIQASNQFLEKQQPYLTTIPGLDDKTTYQPHVAKESDNMLWKQAKSKVDSEQFNYDIGSELPYNPLTTPYPVAYAAETGSNYRADRQEDLSHDSSSLEQIKNALLENKNEKTQAMLKQLDSIKNPDNSINQEKFVELGRRVRLNNAYGTGMYSESEKEFYKLLESSSKGSTTNMTDDLTRFKQTLSNDHQALLGKQQQQEQKQKQTSEPEDSSKNHAKLR